MPQTLPAQTIFREIQRLTQWWLWLLVLGCCVPLWWGFVSQMFLGRPFGNQPMNDLGLIIFTLVFGLGMPLLLAIFKLEIVVRSDALLIRFIPYHRRPLRIDYGTISSVVPGTYNPVRDYGGWGVKSGYGGTVYSVRGKLGVRLELASGKHLMLGTRRPLELAAALNQALKEDTDERSEMAG